MGKAIIISLISLLGVSAHAQKKPVPAVPEISHTHLRIGVAFPTRSMPFYLEVSTGLQQAASQKGYELTINSADVPPQANPDNTLGLQVCAEAEAAAATIAKAATAASRHGRWRLAAESLLSRPGSDPIRLPHPQSGANSGTVPPALGGRRRPFQVRVFDQYLGDQNDATRIWPFWMSRRSNRRPSDALRQHRLSLRVRKRNAHPMAANLCSVRYKFDGSHAL